MSTERKKFNKSPLIHKEYDKEGKLIKEENYDNKFKHTFEQIREIVLREKNVDIYDTRQAIADRFVPNGLIDTYYQIHILNFHISENGEHYVSPKESMVIIDDTGEVITNETLKAKEKKTQQQPSNHLYRTHNGKTYTKEEWKAFEE